MAFVEGGIGAPTLAERTTVALERIACALEAHLAKPPARVVSLPKEHLAELRKWGPWEVTARGPVATNCPPGNLRKRDRAIVAALNAFLADAHD